MNSNERIELCLYVAGNAPNSNRATANLQAICRKHLQDLCQVEIVDVLDDPQRALLDGVLVTPTLVKRSPAPFARIIGDLSETETVLDALGVGNSLT